MPHGLTQRPQPEPASAAAPADFPLGVDDFSYADLYRPERLADLTRAFDRDLAAADAALGTEFAAYRAARGAGIEPIAESKLLVRAAPQLGRFLARLFRIEAEFAAMLRRADAEKELLRFKKDVVLKRLPKEVHPATVDELPFLETQFAALRRAGFPAVATGDLETAAAHMACALLDAAAPGGADRIRALRARLEADPEARAMLAAPLAAPDDPRFAAALLDLLGRWVAGLATDPRGRARVHGWMSLRRAETLNFPDGLVRMVRPRTDLPGFLVGPADTRRRRDGFVLTDPRMEPKDVLHEANYCILCHDRAKDSCARGLPMPRKPEQPVVKNPLGIPLNGCPLEERISEMHTLRRAGDNVGALALVMIDNPMLPGTGHRICNDCMKACIFQKQEPVNIPQIETRVLVDVLALPYGFEIYALLTRWNPLNARRPHMLPYNGKNVLVVGLGPAGYTLAQHLLNEGFGVVGVDGLKIEPLPAALTGAEGVLPRAVRDIAEISARLDERILSGFGGVAEYGITVRWDKNFLTVIQLALMRRSGFRALGGVRFGGTLEIDDCWQLGFDHIAIAAGAGKPTIVEMKNNLLPGIRQASDFLMALQLTGAFKRSSMACLQVELPGVVIGGGLTAIDTATELLAYYPVQVEKTLERWERLAARLGADKVEAAFAPDERRTLATFLDHGRAIRAERERARKAGEAPNFAPLLERWGGVTIAYRKGIVDSPAYRLNHEEVIKCLEEGVRILEGASPVEAIPGADGRVEALRLELLAKTGGDWKATGKQVTLAARTVFVAAGTTPNIIYEREHPGTFEVDAKRRCFKGHQAVAQPDGTWTVAPSKSALDEPGFFTSYAKGGRLISYFGDNHPVFAGSVVKAMASAKKGAPHIAALFARELAALDPKEQPARDARWRNLTRKLTDELVPRVVEVKRLTPTVTELVLHAPQQARKFRAGQFFRLQTYETSGPLVDGTRLATEGLALTGAWVDVGRGLLSLIMLEIGASSRMCALLRPGEAVVAMGPTGEPSCVPAGETVLLAGGGLGNAVLFSYAKALRERGNKVVYFAGYRKPEDLFHREDIEAGTDQVIWSVDRGEAIPARRPQDRNFVGNIVQSMVAYAKGELGEALCPLPTVNRIVAIGSDKMMAAVARARHEALAPWLRADHVAISSINSPMQCMMKEVCGQCLQAQVDPKTGQRASVVFTCFNQDQPSDCVEWKNLADRLRQNTVQEKLTGMWLDYLLEKSSLPRV